MNTSGFFKKGRKEYLTIVITEWEEVNIPPLAENWMEILWLWVVGCVKRTNDEGGMDGGGLLHRNKVRSTECGAFHAPYKGSSALIFARVFFIANWELQNANCKLDKRRSDWLVGAGVAGNRVTGLTGDDMLGRLPYPS